MSTATKPPPRIDLVPGTKDAECHRLVRLLMRAYYQPEHVAVIDCLLDLQHRQANKVTEQDLSSALHLSPKLVREVLHRLRVHQIVRGMQKNDGPTPRVDELTSRGRRKGYVRAPPVTFTWHVDFEHVVKVVQFRHSSIIAALGPASGTKSSGALFACPTPTCSNHTRRLDYLRGEVEVDAQGQFRCSMCSTVDPVTGAAVPTALMLLAQDADPVEDKKKRFNAQLRAVQEQMKLVTDLLERERREGGKVGAVLAAAAAAQAAQAAAAKKAGQIDFGAAAAAAAAASKPAAAAASSSSSSAAAPLSVEDMISVSLSGSADDDRAPSAEVELDPAAKRQKSASASSASSGGLSLSLPSAADRATLAATALPWDKNAAPLSLAKVEEEKARMDEARSEAARAEAARRAQEEKLRFAREYDEQLAKQQAAAQAAQAAAEAAAAAAQDDAMEGEEVEEETILLGGKQVPLSSVTQDDIDQMTAEEFDNYSRLAGEGDDGF